ncbi:MAG: hypothetical protein NVSMB19_15600 [Vulcanimicrobiaceae bacterium]
MSLTALARADRASHVIVNSRKRTSLSTWPMRNEVFDVVNVPPDSTDDEVVAVRRVIGSRRAIVVDERQARAEDACERLASCGASATVLEDGLLGWTQAIVFERADRYDDATVASFVRPARTLRSYVVVTQAGVTIVDACGSATLLLRESESLARLPTSIVDTAYHRDRISCGSECAVRAEAAYWLPPQGEDRIDARFRRRLDDVLCIGGLYVSPVNAGCNLRLDGAGFSIGSHPGATYRTCCGPDAFGSETYAAVNRGIMLVDDGRRWQLEFGPPGCLPA